MSYTHILVPTDFSTLGNRAVAHAVEEAEQHGAALILLHVMQHADTAVYFRAGRPLDPTPVADEFGSTFPRHEIPAAETVRRDFLEEAMTQLRDLIPSTFKGNTDVLVESGHPTDVIVRMAQEHKADLIVMGTHGRSGLPHLLMGSVAEKVVRLAPCSVLVVREQ